MADEMRRRGVPHGDLQELFKRMCYNALLSHHTHFALERDEAEYLLEQVASWEQELKDHYAKVLSGSDLDMACDAASSVRMLK